MTPRSHITVLLPTYNAARTIESAVSSTLRGLPENAVLLVRDDGSTDHTLDLIRRFSDRRLGVIAGSENIGVAKALNTMLELVESPLVARMDADDICLPWRFRSSLRALRGVDVVFTSALAMTDHAALTNRNVPFAIPPELFALHLLIANPVTHSTMVCRTEVLRQIGGYRDTIAEDYDLWLRLAAAGRHLRRIATPTLRYRYHPGQLTADPAWLKRVLQDEFLITSYQSLARKTLGTEAFWLRDLMHIWNGQQGDRARLGEFGRLMRRRGPSRCGPNKLLLDRRLRKFTL